MCCVLCPHDRHRNAVSGSFARVLIDRWHRASQLSHLRELLVFDICSASTVAMWSQLPEAVSIRFECEAEQSFIHRFRHASYLYAMKARMVSLCYVRVWCWRRLWPVRRYHFDCKLDARFIYCSVHRQNVFLRLFARLCAHII